MPREGGLSGRRAQFLRRFAIGNLDTLEEAESSKDVACNRRTRRTVFVQLRTPATGQGEVERRAVSWRVVTGLVIVGLLAMTLLQAAWRTPPGPLEMSLDRLTTGHRFDLTTWEIDAISAKLADLARDPAAG